jgi:quercetin dioxygenase-like cupin family protein
MNKSMQWGLIVVLVILLGGYLWGMSQDLGKSITQMEQTIQQLEETIRMQSMRSGSAALLDPSKLHQKTDPALVDVQPIPDASIVNYFTAPLTKPGVDENDSYLRLVFDRHARPEKMHRMASMWTITLKPGGKNGPHAHSDEEQIYVCVEGEVEFTLGKEKAYTMKEGDAAFLPRYYSHSVENKSNKPARMLAVGAYELDY